MKFCSQCGSEVRLRVPSGDNLPRHVCVACEAIYYQNPKIVAGAILEWRGKILLCRRAIEPRCDFWTVPAGFMELGETTDEAAAREALEEANAQAEDLALYALYNLPRINQVYILFRGSLKDGQASAGIESREVDLFGERDIPWETLAFPVIRQGLRCYFEDRRAGRFGIHTGDIVRGPDSRARVLHQQIMG